MDTTTPDRAALPRGIRNNNPGNIRRGSAGWTGLVEDGTDPAFEQFTHPVFGIRAMARILRVYVRGHGLRTVRGIIHRWAPPVENDTGAYVAHVCDELGGVHPDADLGTPEDPEILCPLVEAIIEHENGMQPYSAWTIGYGCGLAFDDDWPELPPDD